MQSFPHWLNTVCAASLIVGGASAAVIVLDLRRHPQSMTIMNIVWPVCALFGSIALLWFYLKYGRSTSKPFWAGVVTGTLHCGSGCALGDLIAEWLAFAAPSVAIVFGWQSLFYEKSYAVWLLDFVLAFSVGIVFQYLAIVPMRKLAFGEGLVAAVKADALSLIAWQVGMYGGMAALQFRILSWHYGTSAPVDTVEFWAAMQLAMVAGFITSYPMNWWLLRAGVKELM